YSHQKCFACEFTLSSFIAPDIFSFQSLVILEEAAYSFASKESADFFSGSLLSLRGPPSIC
ncbi:MAG TPA: hypothetical protein VFR70_02610, partial [Flavobacterium sp.]|nr:hypothetical protein [Flavobacterium sp.]